MARSKRVLLILAIAGVCWAAPAGNVRLCHENAASNPDAALPACTAAIGSGRLSGADLASASLDRGIAYLAKGDYDLAIRDLDQAIRSQPDLASAFDNRCQAYIDKHEDARALPDCEQAIRLDPKAARPVYRRGHIRFNSGDYDRAMLDVEQAIRLDPNLALAYSARAALRIRRGQYDQAIQDYDRALRLRPDAKDSEMRRWAYYRKAGHSSALPDFFRASWRRTANLGSWGKWLLLLAAASLIYVVLRRRKKKEAGLAVPDRPPVELVTVLETGDSFALKLATASLEEAGIEYVVSGGDPLGLAKSHGIFPHAPGRRGIQVARESESEARALIEPLRNPSPIEDDAEEL